MSGVFRKTQIIQTDPQYQDILTISSAGAIHITGGNTASRPTTLLPTGPMSSVDGYRSSTTPYGMGMIRYNTDMGKLEFFQLSDSNTHLDNFQSNFYWDQVLGRNDANYDYVGRNWSQLTADEYGQMYQDLRLKKDVGTSTSPGRSKPANGNVPLIGGNFMEPRLLVENGTQARPAVTFHSSENTGLYLDPASGGASPNNFVVVLDGAERVRVDNNRTVIRSNLEIDANGYIVLPDGDSADRPSPELGMIRYNTVLRRVEFFQHDEPATNSNNFTNVQSWQQAIGREEARWKFLNRVWDYDPNDGSALGLTHASHHIDLQIQKDFGTSGVPGLSQPASGNAPIASGIAGDYLEPRILIENGILGRPSFTFNSDTTTGINYNGTDSIVFGINGTSRLTLNNTRSTITSNVDVIATGHVLLPSGTTSERTSPAIQGMIRFNTDTLRLEMYHTGVQTTTASPTAIRWESIMGSQEASDKFVEASGDVMYGDLKMVSDATRGDGNEARLVATQGSVARPSITFHHADDTTTNYTQGLYFNENGTNSTLGIAIDGTDAVRILKGGLVINHGDTASRSPGEDGMIRYNTELKRYEGFGNSVWNGLGAVMDVDQNTFISPEHNPAKTWLEEPISPGWNDETLHFVTQGEERFNIRQDLDINFYLPLVLNTNPSSPVNQDPVFDLTGSANQVLTFDGTGAITVPTGTTTQQPSVPVPGMIRYNSESLAMEMFINDNPTYPASGIWVGISAQSGKGSYVKRAGDTMMGNLSMTFNTQPLTVGSWATSHLVLKTDNGTIPSIGFAQMGALPASMGTLALGASSASNPTYLEFMDSSGNLGKVWTSTNDGAASGCDSDLLDGQHGSFYQNATNLNAGTVPTARLPAWVQQIAAVTSTYGSLNISGTTNSSAGLNFIDVSRTLRVSPTQQGSWNNTAADWQWYFDSTAGITTGTGTGSVLVSGLVPVSQIIGFATSNTGLTATTTATTSNVASTIIQRDTSGNFTAGTMTGTATRALYADVAERYEADAIYTPGTVVVFGGEKEITLSEAGYTDDTRVAGVITTNPALLMNEAAGPDETHPGVALLGRVPCKVVGLIRKGSLLVTSKIPGAATAVREAKPGTIIGKALENYSSDEVGVIEIVVMKG